MNERTGARKGMVIAGVSDGRQITFQMHMRFHMTALVPFEETALTIKSIEDG
jgi:hypothetical protein